MTEVFGFLIDTLISFMSWVIQIFLTPLNIIIGQLFPDFSITIIELSDNIVTLFDNMSWAIGILPTSVISLFLFILTIEVAKYTISFNIYVLRRIFKISTSLHDKLGSFSIFS